MTRSSLFIGGCLTLALLAPAGLARTRPASSPGRATVGAGASTFVCDNPDGSADPCPVNIALGRNVTASSSTPGYLPGAVTDSYPYVDTVHDWRSAGSAAAWIRIDLGARRTIGGIGTIVVYGPSGDGVSAFTVETEDPFTNSYQPLVPPPIERNQPGRTIVTLTTPVTTGSLQISWSGALWVSEVEVYLA
jgi:hypothetical protein